MLSKACLVGVYQRKLEELAAAPDVELVVAVPPFWRDERGVTLLERAHTSGYRLEVLPMALNGQFHLHFYPRFGRLLREVAPDVLHIDEEPYNLATWQANWLARRRGIKTLWFSWQNLNRAYPWPFSWWEGYNLQHCDYAIAGSQTAAQVWRTKGYPGPLAVIPQFGVDPAIFAPPQEQGADGPLHIAYVGRLVPEKGVALLLQALQGLPGEWRLTVLGEGPAEEELRTSVAAHSWRERVQFRALIPSVEMPDFYRTVDLLVLPSRSRPNWMEQFGRVLIEAMASGAVPVGSESGEIPHVIGEAGLTFPEGDVAALRTALTRLVQDATLRQELQAQGRARVLAHFTQRQVAQETAVVYREMLAGGESG
ncbi:MAG: glycosyltransferase family 4 protein [Chloroflexota bacterium]|nr:glycosyltransferase family 4 protein [Chloroflexota bacterium]